MQELLNYKLVLKLAWWKWLAIALLFYTLYMSLMGTVPRLPILNESIRNLYFHVTMWFAMIGMMGVSLFHSIKYLRTGAVKSDLIAAESANMGVVLGILGLITGMLWANFTWGYPWNGDPKQNAAAIGVLIYCAYIVLRGAFNDEQQRGRVSAVYNIFAFCIFIPLLFILPRLQDSLHPGDGGNPAFSSYDLDSRMRMVFYPAIIAWSLFAWWITTLKVRLRTLQIQ